MVENETLRPLDDPVSASVASNAGAARPQAGARRSWLELPPGMTAQHARQLVFWTVLGVAGALGFEFLLNHFVHIKPETVQRQVDQFGPLAPLVFVLVLALTVVVTPIPSLPLDIAGGLAFGLWRGAALILAAAMLGASIDFLIARRFACFAMSQ